MIISVIRKANISNIRKYLDKRVLNSSCLEEPLPRFVKEVERKVEKYDGFKFGLQIYYYKGCIIRMDVDVVIYSTSILKPHIVKLELKMMGKG